MEMLTENSVPNFLKNSANTPIRSPSVRLKSAMTPSTWWNSAKCVASKVSFRNTLSILNNFIGLNSFCWATLYSILALTAVVCVLSRFFWASSIFQS